MPQDVTSYIISAAFAVLWYLLKQKDDKQQKALDSLQATHTRELEKAEFIHQDLYGKHTTDVAALAELKLQIAESHYKKVEMDARFDKFEANLQAALAGIDHKLSTLLVARSNHVIEVGNRRRRSSDANLNSIGESTNEHFN